MQIGHLSEESEKALAEFKQYGFTTRTEFVDKAITLFLRMTREERRKKQREAYIADYAKSKPANLFAKIEGESFE